ncbi:MAG: XRE family transcriptional regulator [Actinomycetota bacterium]|jgi:predicted transcriptional regulator|nr:XRE family transcriptional regulator [Actinomycetota bacterium]
MIRGDLSSLRRRAGLTQVELARRWGRAQSQVARLERAPIDSASLRTLRAYVEALGGSCSLSVEVDGDRYDIEL